jgi:hypothetical protein
MLGVGDGEEVDGANCMVGFDNSLNYQTPVHLRIYA